MTKSKTSKLAPESQVIDDPDNEVQDVTPDDAEAQDPAAEQPEPAAEETEVDAGAHARWMQARADLAAARAHLADLEVEDSSAAQARVAAIARGERLSPEAHTAAILAAKNERQAAIEACKEIISGLTAYEETLRESAMADLRRETAAKLAVIAARGRTAAARLLDLWAQTREAFAEVDALFQEHLQTARGFDEAHKAARPECGVAWPNDAATRWIDWPVDIPRIEKAIEASCDRDRRATLPALTADSVIKLDHPKQQRETPAKPWHDPRQNVADPNPGNVQRVGDPLESDSPPAEFTEFPQRFQASYSAAGELVMLRRLADGNVAWKRSNSAA